MAAQISLTRTPQQNVDQTYSQTFLAAGTNMPSEIFVLTQRPVNPAAPSGPQTSNFSRIASPVDLNNLPVGSPLTGQFDYRVATYVNAYLTRDLADTDWANIIVEVNALVSAVNAAAETLSPETVVCTGD